MNNNPFASFWMAGYECSDKLNIHGQRVDLQNATGHIELLEDDYRDLSLFQIKTVREGIRWSQIELSPYHYDWRIVIQLIRAANTFRIQQVWDLCHFGFPSDLTPFHPQFTKRFVAMCYSFADVFFKNNSGPLLITPINEVSFLSWLGGEQAATVPYCSHSGWEIKYALMRAYIEGVSALKEKYSDIIVVSTEPLVNIVPPINCTIEEEKKATVAHEQQFQATDILTGRICPELGGCPELLDVLGLNYYYSNQFELGATAPLPWVNDTEDTRWKPLSQLLISAYNRYEVPVILSETSHPGEHRPNWITYISEECSTVLQQGIPLWGICLYPILSRPDWDDADFWHYSGLWDIDRNTKKRKLDNEYANALFDCQKLLTNSCSQLIAASEYSYSTDKRRFFAND